MVERVDLVLLLIGGTVVVDLRAGRVPMDVREGWCLLFALLPHEVLVRENDVVVTQLVNRPASEPISLSEHHELDRLVPGRPSRNSAVR